MNKLFLSAILFFTLFSNSVIAQSVNWETALSQRIIEKTVIGDRVIIMYGRSNGGEVVNKKRIYPDIVALNTLTGEKVWEIKNPIELMAIKSTTKVTMTPIEGTGYIRFGDLLIVNSKDGTILFSPTEEGITSISHSKLFPEGILARVNLNGKWVQLFLSLTTFNIEWTNEKSFDESQASKKDKAYENLFRNSPTMRSSQPKQSSKKPDYSGKYFNGNYIVKFFKEIVSFNLITGKENWKYQSKNSFTKYKISKNPETGEAIIFFATQKGVSAGKNILHALNINTGEILWKQNINYSISKLITLNDDLSVLVEPEKSIGKRYFQIFNNKGEPYLEDNSLKSFGQGIITVLKQDNRLTIVSKSGESETPLGLDFGIIGRKIGFSKRGMSTKHKAFINIIDSSTKKFVFEKNFKTGDNISYLEPLEGGLLIIEPNQAYTLDYNTGIEKEKSIKSRVRLNFIDDEKGTIYLIPEDASKIYTINKSTGSIKQLVDLKSKNLGISFIRELLLTEDGLILYGLTKKDDLTYSKLDFDGNVIYNKFYPTNNFRKSWTMPIIGLNMYQLSISKKNGIENDEISIVNLTTGNLEDQFSYFINIDGRNKRNIGTYDLDTDSGIIFHAPTSALSSPFDKKSINFNNKGIITAKRFKQE